MTDQPTTLPTRQQLGDVFKSPRLLLQAEALFKQAGQSIPSDVANAQAAADTALALATALTLPQYIVGADSDPLEDGRVLTGAEGVSVDLTVAHIAKIVVDVLAILGVPAAFPEGVSISGDIEVNQTPAQAVGPRLFTIPIMTASGLYYMLVSDAP